MKPTGHIHSTETLGTVDGPGIRLIIFTQGCPLRCLYCHNPDCREIETGRVVTVAELMTEVRKYRSYMRASGGGVTVSGGEPLMQPHFVTEIFHQCHELGIHTALDTSGYCELPVAKPVIDAADLVLLDIKSFDPETYFKITQVPLEPTLDFARYLNEIHKPTWIRFVLVPGLTDHLPHIQKMADFVITLNNVERLEVLPFHKMGEYKWQEMGYPYELSNTQPPTPELIQNVLQIFRDRGINALAG
ncbi:MAG: pyruvate formate-lyase-activating protein [Oculatellaceae cyanobacterium Prado106]|jgi:pyruvate formate lyase activating enzyme|nr:pyruvate formate-lyase-activating protein [Oculatellaceae cyanobacterium Prado106]